MSGFLKNAVLVLLAIVLSAEAFSALSIELGLIKAPKPSYAWPGFEPFRGDINADFGLWRHHNAHLSHVASCFNVTYESNSYGARDIEHTRDADGPRTIVLGDSFVEGIGLNRQERFTEKLEALTATAHLNFGIVNTGPTQYLLTYRHLAKAFAHDRVIVGILPNNDFRDDDFEFGRHALAERYRPYFVKGDDGAWKLIYFDEDNLGTGGNSVKEQRKQQRRAVRQILTNFLYVKNVWNYTKGLMDHKALGIADLRGVYRSVEETRPPSGFYDYQPQELERLEYVLGLLDEETGGRKVSLVLIPLQLDISRFKADGEAPLVRELQRFAATRSDLEVVDLLPDFAELDDPESMYLSCDGHWNAQGASFAADLMARKIYAK